MQMPIIVGIIVGIAFLVGVSEWLYGAVRGIKNTVPEGVHYTKRIIRAVLISIILMALVFWGIALVSECPNPERIREKAFARLRCDEYLKVKTLTKKFFQVGKKSVDYRTK